MSLQSVLWSRPSPSPAVPVPVPVPAPVPASLLLPANLPVGASDQAFLAEMWTPQQQQPHLPPPAAPTAPADAPVSTAAAVVVAPQHTREYNADEHKLSIAEVAARYGCAVDEADLKRSRGLEASVAEERLRTGGKNVLTPPPSTPEIVKLLKQFGNLLLVLLEIAAILGFLAWGLDHEKTNVILAGALLVLVTLTAVMNYVQERSASDVINSIKAMLPAQCKVIRGGHEFPIPAENLVKGDLVHLTIGNRVPADIRVVHASDFKVEMSSLTGESDAVECGPEKRSDLPAEARNLIFNSGLVMSGDCLGIVVRTGDGTMIGSIAGLAGATRGGRTTLEREVLRLVHFVAGLALVTACSFFAIGLGRGLGVVFSFVNAFILVLVANVPEGLPATVTSILNLTAQQLAAKNVFIKRTDLIETLGSASVICSDKTGTLTQNRMTVEHMWLNRTYVKARGEIRRAEPEPETGLEGGAAAPPPAAHVPARDPLESMTIGRGMSFLALPSGDTTAIIHSTTLRMGPLAARSSPAASGLVAPAPSPAGGAEPHPGFPVLSPTQLTRQLTARGGGRAAGGWPAAATARGGQAPGATPTTTTTTTTARRPLSSVFPPSTAESLPPPTTARSPLSSLRGVEEEEGGGETSAAVPFPALRLPPPEAVQAPTPPTPVITGAPGSELTLSGFGIGTTAAAAFAAAVARGAPPPAAAATTTTPSLSPVPARPGLHVAGTPTALPVPGAAAPDDDGDWRSVVSFQSFRGFTTVSWRNANAFTRICCIAAVCNRATFSFPEGGEEEGFVAPAAAGVGEGEATEGGPAAVAGSPPVSPAAIEVVAEGEGGVGAAGVPIPTTARRRRGAASRGSAGAEDALEGGPGSLPVSPPFETRSAPASVARRSFRGAPADHSAEKAMALRRADTLVGPEAFPVRRGTSITRFERVLGKRAPPKFLPASADPRVVLGDASEAALLRYVDTLAPIWEWRSAFRILHEVPFNSVTKWAAAVCPLPEDPERTHLVMLKGAPERVIDRCSFYFDNGTEVPIDDAYRLEWGKAYERFGVMGERVLGFAYRLVPARDPAEYKRDMSAAAAATGAPAAPGNLEAAPSSSLPLDGLVFAGLVSLVDPPKEGTAEAVAACRAASIRVTMVTGDHPLTAEAIARKVGIVTLPTAREVAAEDGVDEADVDIADPRVGAVVLPGYALAALSEPMWDTLLSKQEVVFARTSPQQKLQIVEHYQRLGHVVAVTGDGTNDAPALKRAQIGVSMGSAAASDVAREAADLIIMDDNFASIVFAIETGRTVFDNVKKTVAYTLAHLLPELVPIFCVLVFDIPLPLTGLLILLVDLVTEQGPAISLSREPAEASVMRRPPRNLKTERLIDRPLVLYSYLIIGVLETLACLLAFFTVFIYYGVPRSYVAYHRELWTTDSPSITLDDGTVLTGEDQSIIYRRAVAAYFLTLVLCQAVHIFLCKTRLVSITQHPIFRNRWTIYGVAFSLLVAVLAIYVPEVNKLFGAYYLPGIWWTPFLSFAVVAIAYTEWYKWRARVNPTGRVARWLAW
jgi:magnesium-transporting ATPase (P-type)